MIDQPLHGQVALVTGGSSGVGAAVARSLASFGVTVMLPGRRADRLSEVCASLATPGSTMPADLSDPTAPAAIVDRTVEVYGGLDIVVNSAGLFAARPLAETDDEFWRYIIDLNLSATMAITRAAWPYLHQAGGQVVLISSAAALKGFPGNAAYAASKGGMNAFGEVLREEGRPLGIRVITLCPAQIDTESWDGEASDEVRQAMMRAPSVGALVGALVATDRNIDFAPISIQPPTDPWETQ